MHDVMAVISQLNIYKLLLYVQHSSNSGDLEQNKMAASRNDEVMKCLNLGGVGPVMNLREGPSSSSRTGLLLGPRPGLWPGPWFVLGPFSWESVKYFITSSLRLAAILFFPNLRY
jgi:hypothetical protein